MNNIENSEENRNRCICSGCPSYPHNCDGELLYCAVGKSDSEIHEKGCICFLCPVFNENKLKDLYLCGKESISEANLFMRSKRHNETDSYYQTMVNIKHISAIGSSIVGSMGSRKNLRFTWDDLQFLPAQVYRIPLNAEEKVNNQVIIGPSVRKPLTISSPIMISAVSFGAVSTKVKNIISEVSSKMGIAFNTGEGGVLKEDFEKTSNNIIIQYSTGRFGISADILKKASAIEIRFGQGAYPGKGSYLPASKITPEIAEVRNLEHGEAAYSPAHHPDMRTPEEIKEKISSLRKITDGIPIGAKIGCGKVEKDIEILVEAGVDFISLDGFGGGTGATDLYVRENVGMPLIAALPRAFRYLNELDVKDDISLIAGGGLRTSADFAKCLALGADAVYIATAALIAINCEQYRICHTGKCPQGITTHNPSLLKMLDIDEGKKKLTNFLRVSTEEVANLCRIVGKDDISKLDINDLTSLNRELSMITKVKWLDEL